MAVTFTSRSGGRLSEILTLEREEGNNHDKFAVSLLKRATVSREFLWVFWHILRHGETITCEVRKRGKGTSSASSTILFVRCTQSLSIKRHAPNT